MELNERIRLARKKAGYKSRDALAAVLGSTRDAIANYEQGRVIPSDLFLKVMASTLNLSYNWLKNGVGEMYEKDASALVSALTANLPEVDKEILQTYFELPPELRKIFKDFVKSLAAANKAVQAPPQYSIPKPDGVDDEEWIEFLKKHNARELEKKGATSAVA